MTKLNAKQLSFIEMMKENEDLERHGFELLKSRPDIEVFFDALKESGFFDPSKNPKPVEGSEEGFYHIPYWAALDYLEAIAVLAGKKKKTSLATKVMGVVRSVSKACIKSKSSCDNFHTFRVFAKIISVVPLSVITNKDIDLIPLWLKSRFDHGLVSREIVEGLIPRLLKSKSSDDWDKALKILDHCTNINWIAKKSLGDDDQKPSTAISDYYLDKIIGNNMELYAIKVPLETAKLMVDRLREVFEKTELYGSWSRRPAIEDHTQNHSFYKTENFFVVALRDTLSIWAHKDPNVAKTFVGNLISDQSEIIRRVAIYLIDTNWNIFKDIYSNNLSSDLFQSAYTHELYHLLNNNFESFSGELQRKTLDTIKNIPLPSSADNPERSLKYKQRNWLSAIYKKGLSSADKLFDQLSSDADLGSLSDHPDFISYSSGVMRGFGDSPYEASELLAFAKENTLVSKLNAFEQKDTWRGPTTRSLIDTLEKAVQTEPKTFSNIIEAFQDADRPYQYGIINGFKKLWDASSLSENALDWDEVWSKLVSFFESLIGTEGFWKEDIIEDENFTPTRAWIPPLIADFIQSGTRNDEKSYSPKLLPQTWEIVIILVQRSEAAAEAATSDAMSQAINTAKGRAIEAMINHALRNCRVSDEEYGNHLKIWAKMQPIFDEELMKCKNANFEFSTLMATYISNLTYMDKGWVKKQFKEIFNPDYLSNYRCALDGLAYATATKHIYELLLEHKVIEFSLKKKLGGDVAREKLIERMALAYLWGTEDISSPRFSYLFKSSMISELKIMTNVFHRVYEEEIPDEMTARVLSFWKKCVSWSKNINPTPAKLLSSLSELSCYLKSIGKQEKELLLAVTPYVKVDYHADRFIEQLYRLVDVSPDEVCDILGQLLESYIPYYDYEDTLKNLIKKLSEKGHKAEAITYTNKLRNSISGMLKLYMELIEEA